MIILIIKKEKVKDKKIFFNKRVHKEKEFIRDIFNNTKNINNFEKKIL